MPQSKPRSDWQQVKLHSIPTWAREIEQRGFARLPRIFAEAAVECCLGELEHCMTEAPPAAILRSQQGTPYAARNLLQWFPASSQFWRRPALLALLHEVLGPQAGLVRALFFDKPPDRSWALPWHQDLTIAVRAHRPKCALFDKPTTKAGVPHVEASAELLERMLTLRVHLDEVTQQNGPLRVIPASHRMGKQLSLGDDTDPAVILADRGDVLAIRPLVVHSSGGSQPGTSRHRRILHLEFAAQRDLPADYAWHDFIAISDPPAGQPDTSHQAANAS